MSEYLSLVEETVHGGLSHYLQVICRIAGAAGFQAIAFSRHHVAVTHPGQAASFKSKFLIRKAKLEDGRIMLSAISEAKSH